MGVIICTEGEMVGGGELVGGGSCGICGEKGVGVGVVRCGGCRTVERDVVGDGTVGWGRIV